MKLSDLWGLVKDAANGWSEHKATRLSAAVAYYTILSLAPLVVLAVAIAGFVYDEASARDQLRDQIRGMVGDAGAEVVKTALEKADKPAHGIWATVVGVATLLFGASGVFGELQDSLNTVWGVRPKPDRGWREIVRDRFLSFGMVLVIGFLLLVSLVVSTVLSAMNGYLNQYVTTSPVLLQAVNLLVSLGVITVLFALIFKVLPDVHMGWREAFLGAAVTAVLFTVGKYLIGLYLGKAGIETPFGAAGSLVAFVVWVYYSALILFFGAEVTRAHAVKYGYARPASNAEPLPGSDLDAQGPAAPQPA